MIDRGRNHDVFVTAIEGGISYWAAVEDYDWDRDDWFATIAELEEIGDDEDLPLQTINVWTIIEADGTSQKPA